MELFSVLTFWSLREVTSCRKSATPCKRGVDLSRALSPVVTSSPAKGSKTPV